MDDKEMRKMLREMNARIYDMRTQLMADRNRMATRNQLADFRDKVSRRLFHFAIGFTAVMLCGFLAM